MSPAPATVESFFSPPMAYPGPTWTKDGQPVKAEELSSIAGPEHCEWESAVLMYVGWPLGTVARTVDEARQFIRDPEGVIGERYQKNLERSVEMPADARDTGYRSGTLELWLSPSREEAAYVRAGEDVELWPRAENPIGCK